MRVAKVFFEKIMPRVDDTMKGGAKRLARFETAFIERFPDMTLDGGLADVFTPLLFERAWDLYYLGLNSSVFIELYSTLESLHLVFLPRVLGRDETSARVIASLIERKTLPEFAQVSCDLGVWDEQDVRFARKLAQIRNGIAHKNEDLVSKHLGDGKALARDAAIFADQVDSLPYFMDAIHLAVKWLKMLQDLPSDSKKWEL